MEALLAQIRFFYTLENSRAGPRTREFGLHFGTKLRLFLLEASAELESVIEDPPFDELSELKALMIEKLMEGVKSGLAPK